MSGTVPRVPFLWCAVLVAAALRAEGQSGNLEPKGVQAAEIADRRAHLPSPTAEGSAENMETVYNETERAMDELRMALRSGPTPGNGIGFTFDSATWRASVADHKLGWFLQCTSEVLECQSTCNAWCAERQDKVYEKECKDACFAEACNRQCAQCDPRATKLELGSLLPCDGFDAGQPRHRGNKPSQVCPDDWSKGPHNLILEQGNPASQKMYGPDNKSPVFMCKRVTDGTVEAITLRSLSADLKLLDGTQILSKGLMMHPKGTATNILAVGFKRVVCHPRSTMGQTACDVHKVLYCIRCDQYITKEGDPQCTGKCLQEVAAQKQARFKDCLEDKWKNQEGKCCHQACHRMSMDAQHFDASPIVEGLPNFQRAAQCVQKAFTKKGVDSKMRCDSHIEEQIETTAQGSTSSTSFKQNERKTKTAIQAVAATL